MQDRSRLRAAPRAAGPVSGAIAGACRAASRLRRRIREIQTDDAMDRGAELEAQDLAARGAFPTQSTCGVVRSIAAGQRPVVELEGEVAARLLERCVIGQVMWNPPELVRDGGQDPGWSHDPHPGYDLFSPGSWWPLPFGVVEDLARSRPCNRRSVSGTTRTVAVASTVEMRIMAEDARARTWAARFMEYA